MGILRVRVAGLMALLLASGVASANEWELIMTGPITVKTRALSGTTVKEVWAEAVLDAEVRDLQSAILDSRAYPRFMPYVREVRMIEGPAEDGATVVYTRLALPFLNERNYVVRVFVDRGVSEGGTGEFANRWVADPNRIPEVPNVVRLRFNQGSWHVFPLPDGRSRVIYRMAVDPGGWVPGFAVDLANKKGVTDTFHAVEKEAKERGALRRRQAATAETAAPAPARQ